MPFGEPWVRQINWNYALLHGESRYTFTGKERDEETGLMYFGARYYDPEYGIWNQVDPLHAKYPGLSSYNYCGNNPLSNIDPNGESAVNVLTDYRNTKGELLYRTEDGLKETIIVSDAKVPTLVQKLQISQDDGTINNPDFNKNELHILGKNINTYADGYKTGTEKLDKGFQIGYEDGYSGESHDFSNIWFKYLVNFFMSMPEGGQMSAGYREGEAEGTNDKKNGFINMLDPYRSLKNNSPLIRLNTHTKQGKCTLK
jgi:RHS repeat-associated protein